MKLLDIICPPRCCVCSATLNTSFHNIEHQCYICKNCQPFYPSTKSETSPLASNGIRYIRCPLCGDWDYVFDNEEVLSCLPCRITPLSVRQLVSVFDYSGKTQALIKAIKYRGQWQATSYGAAILHDAIPAVFGDDFADWDIILPMPSAKGTLTTRGFSHTGLLAKKLAKALHLPCNCTSLRCRGKHSDQASLSFASRRKNVHNTFVLMDKRLKGKHVLLVDDVVTTGASITEAAQSLLTAGVKTVDAITLARSLNFRYARLARG